MRRKAALSRAPGGRDNAGRFTPPGSVLPLNAREWRVTGALSAVYAVRMLGLFAVLPVLALHARHLPGGSALAIGLAVGVYGLTQALFQVPFGALSDRYGRRAVITVGLVLFVAGSVLAALATSVPQLIAGRALQGAGAVAGVIMALLADSTREEVRTRAMALIGMSIGASYLLALPLGPLLAGVVGVTGLFHGVAVLGVVAIALLWLTVPAPEHPAPRSDAPGGLGRVLRNGALARLNFSIFALHALMTGFFIMLPQLLHDVLGLPTGAQGRWYIPLVLISIAGMVPVLVWAERRRHLRGGMLVAVTLLAAALGMLGAGQGPWLLAGAVAVFLTGFNVLESLLPSLVSRLAPLEGRGAALGVYSTAQFLGSFAGGAGGGVLYGTWGTVGVIVPGAVLCVLWLGLLAAWRGPAAWLTRVVRVGTIGPEQARSLQARLAALAGVRESVVMAEAGIAWLKVDRHGFDPASVDRVLAGQA